MAGTPQLVSTSAYTSSQLTPTTETFMSEIAAGGAMMPTVLSAGGQFRGLVDHFGGGNTMGFRPLRRVKQFLTDPNDNIPLMKRILFESEDFLTDENDRELSFRVPMMKLLEDHNKYRITVRDRTFKDKEVFLEEARIDDLRLTTVTIYNI